MIGHNFDVFYEFFSTSQTFKHNVGFACSLSWIIHGFSWFHMDFSWGNYFWMILIMVVPMDPLYISMGVSCENNLYWTTDLFNGPIHDV